jgi:predicted nucleic acid-binding protein
VRIYLDSAPIVYLVEQNPVFGPKVATWLLTHPGDLVSSELGRMESLVLPTRNADAGLIVDFEQFFATQIAEMAALRRDLFDRAIEIRAAFPSIRTPDAIHLATAVVSGCDVFLCNDAQLKQYPGIRVELI